MRNSVMLLVALRAAFGQDEVNHGIERYRVGVGGLLFVPSSVAVHLVHNGGFQVVQQPGTMPCDASAHRSYSGGLPKSERATV
jgi:hypothetical protein